MSQHQSEAQPWITWHKIIIILTLVTFLIGDNIYKQMIGESIFDTIYNYLTRTPEPSPPSSIDRPPDRWLRSSAIPLEMKLSESKSNPNPAQELQQLGWMNNQVNTYTNPQICQSPRGLNKLAMQAILFQDANGAKKAFDNWYYEEISHFGPITSNNQVGEIAYTNWANYVNDDCSPPYDLRFFSILFKRNNAIGVVQLDGIIGTIREDELEGLAIKLAQEMDRKMRDEIE